MAGERSEPDAARLLEQIASAHRLALLGALSGMVAHEFRNLMTPALAYAQEAARVGEPPLMKKALERVVRQTDRAMGISERLVQLAHAAPQTTQSCGLRAAVEDALLSVARPLERDGVELTLDVGDELRLRADPLLLEQVLLNLLLNARQAIRPASGAVRVAARREGPFVVIDVCDTGRGLARRDVAERINPFLAADARAAPADFLDVGLGLNVCRLIVQSYGGALEVVAHDGPGCTVRVRWPAA